MPGGSGDVPPCMCEKSFALILAAVSSDVAAVAAVAEGKTDTPIVSDIRDEAFLGSSKSKKRTKNASSHEHVPGVAKKQSCRLRFLRLQRESASMYYNVFQRNLTSEMALQKCLFNSPESV